jgi:hypothetical protein
MTGSKRVPALSLVFGVLGSILACASCGGGGGSASPDAGNTGNPGATVGPAACTQLAQSICSRDVACNAPDASAQQASDCVRLQGIAFGCDLAPATLSFDSCLTDVRTLSCDSLFATADLPGACNTSLNMVPLSDPQMKCALLVQAICQKAAMCHGTVLTQDDLSQCVFDGYSQVECGLATGVNATYDQCVTDYGNSPCTAGDGGTGADGGAPTIPSCDNPLTFAK